MFMENSIHQSSYSPSLLRIGVIVLLALTPTAFIHSIAFSQTTSFYLPQDVRALAATALKNNQALQSRKDTVEALKAEIPLAGSLENPQLSLGLANLPVDTFDFDQEPMTQKQIYISQKIPWFGKLSLAEKIATLNASQQEFIFESNQLRVIREISQTWYELGFIRYNLSIIASLEEIIQQTLKIAETKYYTGKGLQQDILTAQVRLSGLIDERISLEGKRQQYESDMAELLNSDDHFNSSSTQYESIAIPSLPPRNELIDKALSQNPDFTALLISREIAAHRVALAEKDYGTDMNFRLGYGQREEDPVSGNDRADFFSATVSFSLPVWQSTRQDSALEAMEKRNRAAEKNILSFRKTLPHRVDGLLAEISTAIETHMLFKNALILQAEQLAESSLAAYSVGKLDFNTMLNARVQTLRYRIQAEKFRLQAFKKIAVLYELMGEPVSLLTSSDRVTATGEKEQ